MKVAVIAGRKRDRVLVEELSTHLLMQLEHDVQYALKHKKPEWDNGRTYRVNFMGAWRQTVTHRLREATKKAEATVAADTNVSSSVSLVTTNKVNGAKAYLHGKGMYFQSSSRSNSSYSSAGRSDGAHAGSRADLSGGRTGRIKSRGAIEA
jgi:hypothetical protein